MDLNSASAASGIGNQYITYITVYTVPTATGTLRFTSTIYTSVPGTQVYGIRGIFGFFGFSPISNTRRFEIPPVGLLLLTSGVR